VKLETYAYTHGTLQQLIDAGVDVDLARYISKLPDYWRKGHAAAKPYLTITDRENFLLKRIDVDHPMAILLCELNDTFNPIRMPFKLFRIGMYTASRANISDLIDGNIWHRVNGITTLFVPKNKKVQQAIKSLTKLMSKISPKYTEKIIWSAIHLASKYELEEIPFWT
jgi:hypothetical protein